MSIWKKMDALKKGTIDWTRDVGLAFASGPKFFWDIVTAPWNDREEFNGFLNTIARTAAKIEHIDPDLAPLAELW